MQRIFCMYPYERSRQEYLEPIQQAIAVLSMAQASIDSWSKDPKTYALYVEEYLKKRGWLSYNRGSTSSLEAIAQLNNLNIYVWQHSSSNPSRLELMHQAHHGIGEGANTIHLLHTHGLTHFNFLVEARP